MGRGGWAGAGRSAAAARALVRSLPRTPSSVRPAVMLRALFLVSCAFGVLPVQGPAPSAELHETPWRELSLPRGFVLDLERGRVSDRPYSADRPLLEWGERGLTATVPLRFLDGIAPVGPRRRIARDQGSQTSELSVVAGVEAAFDLGQRGWGYLRVVEASESTCRLEYAFEGDPELDVLERDPALLAARSLREGIELTWEGSGTGPVRIERRPLGYGVGTAGDGWEETARVEGGRWRDESAPPGASFEYRVRRQASSSGFGNRVVGVAGLAPESEALPLAKGRRIDLVSCSVASARVDLRVEYVGTNGAQFSVGPLVRAHLLAPVEARTWSLPEPSERTYKSERIFVPVGKALAVVTPEGFFARVSVEVEGAGEVILRRQINLTGGRTFLPSPPPPNLTWIGGRGVTFVFPAAALECSEAEQASIVVERREGGQAGDWAPCVQGTSGQRELVDADPGAGGLVRYRFRYALPDGARSLAGPPLGILVGDDGGPLTAQLIERCVADLAHPEFARRSEARDILTAIGEPAFPSLRVALGSADPERAAAARDLIEAGRAGSTEDRRAGVESLAGVLLETRALADGLGTPPSADWLAPAPGARALAMLCDLLGAPTTLPAPDDAALERWRALLAEADPAAGVRLLAAFVPELAAAPREDISGRIARTRGPAPTGPPDWDLGGLEVLSAAALRADLARRIDLEDPWSALVRLQVLRDLEHADPSLVGGVSLERETAALRRALLAESLLARRADSASVSSPDPFMQAALAVIDDPGARLKGALDLADLRLERAPGESGVERESLRIEEPSTPLLFAAVADLEAAGIENVDLFLPPGVYPAEASSGTLRIAVDGLRIVGEGECVLGFGLSIQNGAEVALEGLRIAPVGSTAVSCMSARVSLRDCTIEASLVGIQASGAVVELSHTTLLGSGSNANSGGVRMTGGSLLLARESRIESGIGAIFGARAALLERCAVIGILRGGIIGASDSELWLVDSYVEAATNAISKMQRGVIAGSVLVGDGMAGGSLGEELFVCPDHLSSDGSAGDLGAAPLLDHCPFGR